MSVVVSGRTKRRRAKRPAVSVAMGAPAWSRDERTLFYVDSDPKSYYRIVARDNKPEPPNESFSGNVVFNAPTPADITQRRNELEASALANLHGILGGANGA